MYKICNRFTLSIIMVLLVHILPKKWKKKIEFNINITKCKSQICVQLFKFNSSKPKI